MAGYLGSVEYAVAEPWPGVVDRDNRFAVSGARPGVRTFRVYGFDLGVTSVPGCPGLIAEIENPRIFYRGTADAQGEITFERFAKKLKRGRTFVFPGR